MLVGVTGANGHLGNVVCRILLEKGFRVRVLIRRDTPALQGLSVESFRGDVLDTASLNQFAAGCDYVIHAAAIISIHGDPTGIVFKTNTEGPKNVVEACIKQGVKKIVHVSSTHAVEEIPLDIPYDENRPYKQKGSYAYDFSKSTGEQLMMEYFKSGKIQGCVVRPSLILGPYDFRPSEIGKAMRDLYHQKIPMLPPGGYSFIDVRNVAESVVTALDKGRNGEAYLLSGVYYTLKDFATIIHDVTGKKMPRMVMPFWLMRLLLPFVKLYGKLKGANPVFTKEAIDALKYGHPNMINEKAKHELGHTCIPLKQTVADFFDWYLNQSNGKVNTESSTTTTIKQKETQEV